MFADPANSPDREDPGSSTWITHQVLWSLPLRASLQPACRHVLYLLPGKVYRLLFGPDESLMQVHLYQNQGQLSEDLFLRLLFEQVKEFTQPYLAIEVVIGTGCPLLLPQVALAPPHLLAQARLFLDDAALEEELNVTHIPEMEAGILSLIPSTIRYVLTHYLPEASYAHVGRNLIRLSEGLPSEEGNSLLLHLGIGEVFFVARREGEVVLCNRYLFESALEVMYYAHAVREATQMKDVPVACYLSGESDQADSEGTSLWSYLDAWQVPTPELFGIEAPRKDAAYWLVGFLGMREAV